MGQDRNAGNEGDQLKHCLLAEVLGRCLAWPSITYAETHAGAGIYDATKQSAEKAHISNLKELAESLDAIKESDAGGRYARLLKTWWSKDDRKDYYPGSVLQAAIQLRQRAKDMTQAHFRVTEACEDTHKRLAEATEDVHVEPKLSGFQDEIKWLTEYDNLVLLIDPFTYTNDKNALNKGHIDLETLTEVLAKCWDKSACVVGFWCAMGQNQPVAKQMQLRFTSTLRQLAERHSDSFRFFAFRQYSITWIGISDGRTVVDDIPNCNEWKQSWLKRIVKEKTE